MTNDQVPPANPIGRPRARDVDAAGHRRLLMQVSKAHYVEGKSKLEAAEALGISRFKVARYLEEARELGIVSITVNSNLPLLELSAELAEHLGLRNARVVEVYGDVDNVRAVVGRAAGGVLHEQLEDGEVLGIGWGRTLNTMFDNFENLPTVEIVQLSGKFGGDVNNSAAALTRRMSALSGGDVRVIRAPFFIDDAREAVAVRKHPRVASVVADFDRITTAVVGIGSVGPTPISMAYSAAPTHIARRIIDSGAIGEVQGSLFAADGHTVDTNLWRHTLTITPRQLARVGRVIAAAADPAKAEAVRAVCSSGILTDLVVDVRLATALLELPAVTDFYHDER